jgi:hypothetical protein
MVIGVVTVAVGVSAAGGFSAVLPGRIGIGISVNKNDVFYCYSLI